MQQNKEHLELWAQEKSDYEEDLKNQTALRAAERNDTVGACVVSADVIDRLATGYTTSKRKTWDACFCGFLRRRNKQHKGDQKSRKRNRRQMHRKNVQKSET